MSSNEHVCSYCRTHEHEETMGIKSVDPKLDKNWFCSTNCLCMYKKNGHKSAPLKKYKSLKKKRRNQFSN